MGLNADPKGEVDEDDDKIAEDLSEAGFMCESADLLIGSFLLLSHILIILSP